MASKQPTTNSNKRHQCNQLSSSTLGTGKLSANKAGANQLCSLAWTAGANTHAHAHTHILMAGKRKSYYKLIKSVKCFQSKRKKTRSKNGKYFLVTLLKKKRKKKGQSVIQKNKTLISSSPSGAGLDESMCSFPRGIWRRWSFWIKLPGI